MKTQGRLFIVSSSSGAGKSSLVDALLHRINNVNVLSRVITYTSKEPRKGERPGLDYHFISSREFEENIQNGFFLEWSGRYGHYYGSPFSIITELKAGKSLILIVDSLGARNIGRIISNTVLIWIDIPSILILEERLRMRNTETEEQIIKRLVLAQQELEPEHTNFFHYKIVNDVFEKALQEIELIVFKALKKID